MNNESLWRPSRYTVLNNRYTQSYFRRFGGRRFEQSGAGNNWAKGHYTEDSELIDSVLDIVAIA